MLGPTFLPCSFLARPKQSSGVEATPQRRDGLPREAKQGPREWQVRPSGQQRSECTGQGAWLNIGGLVDVRNPELIITKWPGPNQKTGLQAWPRL